MKTKNWASITKKACKVVCGIGIIISLGLGYSYVKSAITRNKTIVTYSKLWGQYYQGLYPLKLEYFTIIGARAITGTLNPPQDSLIYRLSKWVRMRAYERAAGVLPADDLLLYFLKLHSDIDAKYATPQNAVEIYDRLIEMANASLTKKVRLRNKSTEDKLLAKKAQHWMFTVAIMEELSNANFLRSLKHGEPIKYNNMTKEFCIIINALETDNIYLPFPLGLTCLGPIWSRYIIEYKGGDGCNTSDMAALIKQFNITIQQLIIANEHHIARNRDSKTILGGSVNGMLTLKGMLSSACPNRAKEFKSLPNNLM